MAPAPLTTEERRELSDHFAALDSSGLETVRILAKHPMSGVFNSGASLIDALALAWTGGRGRGRAAWAAFVREFIGEDFVPLHDELRNPQLHSAAANIALTSGNKDRGLHRKTVGGFYHLHTEEFARDLETAFQNFRGRAQDDPVIGRRALSHFRRNAPVRAVPFYGVPRTLRLQRARPQCCSPHRAVCDIRRVRRATWRSQSHASDEENVGKAARGFM